LRLDGNLEMVRARIEEGLAADSPRTRMIATACYLIDVLCLRVGDEKDPDEADTVGATTLRPEHMELAADGTATFRFLGKDSVAWHKTLKPPQVVLDNLADLRRSARPSRAAALDERGHPTRGLPQLFPDITSRDVNAFLASLLPGLTAKVFRTYHATKLVRESLSASGVVAKDPEYIKWRAASLANMEAAVLCNHTKQYTGNWDSAQARYQQQRARAEERLAKYRAQVAELRDKLAQLKEEARAKVAAAAAPEAQAKAEARDAQRTGAADARVKAVREQVRRADLSLGKLKAQHLVNGNKRTLNLGTSLKSYIDPRVYYRWGQEVRYDALERYYPTTLRRKYAWVRTLADRSQVQADASDLVVRTCLSTDLAAVAQLVAAASEETPGLAVSADAAELGARYLPALDRSWCEALIAVASEGQTVALLALGPVWEAEEQAHMDVLCLVHPDHHSLALARLLATEANDRLRIYQLTQPKQHLALRPRDPAWCAHAPEVAEELGLVEQEDEADVGDSPSLK
ncbi:MAG: hypothetical protein V1772_12110, partial [Chloroflexota bacterium]